MIIGFVWCLRCIQLTHGMCFGCKKVDVVAQEKKKNDFINPVVHMNSSFGPREYNFTLLNIFFIRILVMGSVNLWNGVSMNVCVLELKALVLG
jgi:hypothetical protein